MFQKASKYTVILVILTALIISSTQGKASKHPGASIRLQPQPIGSAPHAVYTTSAMAELAGLSLSRVGKRLQTRPSAQHRDQLTLLLLPVAAARVRGAALY